MCQRGHHLVPVDEIGPELDCLDSLGGIELYHRAGDLLRRRPYGPDVSMPIPVSHEEGIEELAHIIDLF